MPLDIEEAAAAFLHQGFFLQFQPIIDIDRRHIRAAVPQLHHDRQNIVSLCGHGRALGVAQRVPGEPDNLAAFVADIAQDAELFQDVQGI